MRRLILWGTIAGFTACLLRPTLVAITPEYHYVDGCLDVSISGHHLEDVELTGKLRKSRFSHGGPGGPEVEFALVPPEETEVDGGIDIDGDGEADRPEWASDIGYRYDAVIPASPDGESGWYDVILTSADGEELVIEDGWYYRTCPAPFRVDQYLVPEGATAGSQLDFVGCGLDQEVTVQYVDPVTYAVAGSSDLVSDCSTAIVHAIVPALAGGTYNVQLVHADGYTIFTPLACASDSGDSGIVCVPATVTVGGTP